MTPSPPDVTLGSIFFPKSMFDPVALGDSSDLRELLDIACLNPANP
jgi:hypothetical protein